MTPKNLFIVILRILGIFFIKDIVEAIPGVLSGLRYIGGDSMEGGIFLSVFSLLIFIVYLLVSYGLIFRSEKIVRVLKLDEGFDQERFSFGFSPSSVLAIALIVTGLFIVIVEVPDLCRQLYTYFQMKRFAFGQAGPQVSSVVARGVKILIGLLLIGERKRIAGFILKKQAGSDV